jgi:8-oxo-dGTP diphosphatase
MRRRPASRLIVLDQTGRVLLFRSVHRTGVLAGLTYWATPGGAVEDGESFGEAAIRELKEETGLIVDTAGAEIARREFLLKLPDGEKVMAEERFFLVRTKTFEPSSKAWTQEESEFLTDHKWWPREELAATADKVFPENLVAILEGLSVRI